MISRSFVPLIGALILASVPGTANSAEYRGIRVIAHRGAGFEFDENTIEGCRQSYERGLRGFEVDLRLTRDNHLVLMHDADVSRTTDGTGRIEEMTLAEVKKLRTKKNGVPVPSGADLVAYFKDKPDVMFLLEMKTSDVKAYPEERLTVYCRALSELVRGLPRGTYWFTSFDRRALAEMKRLAPEAPTGLLTSGPATPELITEAKSLGCGRLSVSLETTPRKLAREIREAGLELSLWPIRTIEDADFAAVFKPSILCTDIPSELLPTAPRTPAQP